MILIFAFLFLLLIKRHPKYLLQLILTTIHQFLIMLNLLNMVSLHQIKVMAQHMITQIILIQQLLANGAR